MNRLPCPTAATDDAAPRAATQAATPADSERPAYHHGDLKEALVSAAIEIVAAEGAENFSLAKACRRAGVSTAAPYKHFKDREEVLAIVVARGFNTMGALTQAAIEQAGVGTVAGIVAMGRAYIAFATDQQQLFRLMFGQHPQLKSDARVMIDGLGCFSVVIEQVETFCRMNNVPGEPREIAVRLWTFVHGLACLRINGDYDIVVPDLDTDRMCADVTPLLLGLRPD